MRIGTFNVHGWGDSAGRSRVDELIAVVAATRCDVLVLNEVISPGGPLLRLADALNLQAFFGAAGYGGNAVLAPRGSTARTVRLQVPGSEARSAVIVDLVGGFHVVGVHLDYRREALRLEQLQLLLAELAGLGPHVVAGDLNAMDLRDHPPDEQAAIIAHRARSGWEPAAEDVVRRLRGAGYVDTARFDVEVDAPLPPERRSTCWVGTRIDHIWLDPRLARTARVVAVDVIDTDVSDHRPVMVDFET